MERSAGSRPRFDGVGPEIRGTWACVKPPVSGSGGPVGGWTERPRRVAACLFPTCRRRSNRAMPTTQPSLVDVITRQ